MSNEFSFLGPGEQTRYHPRKGTWELSAPSRRPGQALSRGAGCRGDRSLQEKTTSISSAFAQRHDPGHSPGGTRALWEPLTPLFPLGKNRTINPSTLGLSVGKPTVRPALPGRFWRSLFVTSQISDTNRVVPRDGSLTEKTKSSSQQRRAGSVHILSSSSAPP